MRSVWSKKMDLVIDGLVLWHEGILRKNKWVSKSISFKFHISYFKLILNWLNLFLFEMQHMGAARKFCRGWAKTNIPFFQLSGARPNFCPYMAAPMMYYTNIFAFCKYIRILKWFQILRIITRIIIKGWTWISNSFA